MKFRYPVFALVLLAALPAFAVAGEIRVAVKGMVCSFCAQGIQKKFGAEPAVARVEPVLKDHVVILEERAGASISDERITTLLKESGYAVEGIARK